MNCQKENYLLPVVCAIFKKAYWNGGRIVTSNWAASKKCKQNQPEVIAFSEACQLWDGEYQEKSIQMFLFTDHSTFIGKRHSANALFYVLHLKQLEDKYSAG